MGQAKRQLAEQEQKRINKLEGYRKHLHNESTYVMDCPYCCNALSKYDMQKDDCLHCGYPLNFSDED